MFFSATVDDLSRSVEFILDLDVPHYYLSLAMDNAWSQPAIKKLEKELGLGKTIKKKLVKSSHGSTVRPVKKMRFEIAGRRFNMKFTVADRSNLKYKVLIGQNVLKRNFLIDASKK